VIVSVDNAAVKVVRLRITKMVHTVNTAVLLP
jgi:hypothetical protein